MKSDGSVDDDLSFGSQSSPHKRATTSLGEPPDPSPTWEPIGTLDKGAQASAGVLRKPLNELGGVRVSRQRDRLPGE